MFQFFVESSQIGNDLITIEGADSKHIRNVLRMKKGERIRVSDGQGMNYLCDIKDFSGEVVLAEIVEKEVASTELPSKVYLFQALPKGDRIETIIEKCVELGVYEIIPVEMKNCVVKLDDKKKANKIKRYQAIAEAAAKQSKRSIIPNIHDVLSFKQAVAYAKEISDVLLFPYEREDGMNAYVESMELVQPGKDISVFIGPEGGFADDEVNEAKDSMHIISLGKRILRTDTAAITSMAAIMLKLETDTNR